MYPSLPLLFATLLILATCECSKRHKHRIRSSNPTKPTQTTTQPLVIGGIPEQKLHSIDEINSNADVEVLKQQLIQPMMIGGRPVQLYTKKEMNKTVEDLDFVRTKIAETYGITPVLTHSPMIDDILFTPRQAAQLADRFRYPEENQRKKREIHDDLHELWPKKTIYYTTWNQSFSTDMLNLIQTAITFYNTHTCLNYVYFDINSTEPSNDYIVFTGNSNTCSAERGYESGRRVVTLGPKCDVIGTVLHEIAHTLGVYHEHQRRDRDDHVTILWDNIRNRGQGNFVPCSDKRQKCIFSDYPYDYGSIMHYHQQTLAKDYYTMITIKAHDARYQQTMGYRKGSMTFYDLKLINTIYCSVHTPSNGSQVHANPCTGSNPCVNEGYLNPANCAQCICPEPYDPSTNCSTRYPGDPESCGGDYTGSTENKTFTSPDWPNVRGWDGYTCVYIVTCDAGRRINYGFSGTFSIAYVTRGNGTYVYCHSQWVEIRDENLINTGPRYCKSNPTPPGGWISSSNTVILILKDTKNYSWNGFQFYYRCV